MLGAEPLQVVLVLGRLGSEKFVVGASAAFLVLLNDSLMLLFEFTYGFFVSILNFCKLCRFELLN